MGRPRLRGFDGKEQALLSWEAAQSEDWLCKWAEPDADQRLDAQVPTVGAPARGRRASAEGGRPRDEARHSPLAAVSHPEGGDPDEGVARKLRLKLNGNF